MNNLTTNKRGVMQLISDGADKAGILKALSSLVVADILGAGYPTIAALRKPEIHGPQRVHGVLASLIVDASGYFEQAIDKETAIELAIEIGAEFYYLTLEDVFVCLQKLKREKVYGKLTANKVLNAMSLYAEGRISLAEQKSLEAHAHSTDSRINYDDATASHKATRTDELFAQFNDAYKKKEQ